MLWLEHDSTIRVRFQFTIRLREKKRTVYSTELYRIIYTIYILQLYPEHWRRIALGPLRCDCHARHIQRGQAG